MCILTGVLMGATGTTAAAAIIAGAGVGVGVGSLTGVGVGIGCNRRFKKHIFSPLGSYHLI